MCGFVYVFDSDTIGGEKKAVEFVARALDHMSYRGLPGRYGMGVVGPSVLGHVRLPIMNQSREYDQPLEAFGQVVLHVGEVFNYQNFLPDAPTDTVAIASEFSLHGLSTFHKFDGFWSTVLCDPKRGSSVVVTDYLGQKPVYWHRVKNVFASELTPLLELGVTLNPLYLSNVRKWGYDPTGRTPYSEIHHLPPGHAVLCSHRRSLTELVNYFDWTRIIPDRPLRELVSEAVTNRLAGDRPVAVLVSGGLDSAIVYSLLKMRSPDTIQAFHVDNDEEGFARMVAPNVQPLSYRSLSVEEAMRVHQVPVDLGSVVPQLALAKAIAEKGYNVVMTGDGADELFGGYRRALEYDSQYSDTFCELPFYHLPRLDRLMMRHTVELRTPFLAPKVIAEALLTPYSQRTYKQRLREEFSDIVPEAVIKREKKPLKAFRFLNHATAAAYRQQLVDTFVCNFNQEHA